MQAGSQLTMVALAHYIRKLAMLVLVLFVEQMASPSGLVVPKWLDWLVYLMKLRTAAKQLVLTVRARDKSNEWDEDELEQAAEFLELNGFESSSTFLSCIALCYYLLVAL